MGRIADHFVEGSEAYTNRELKLFGEVMTRLLGSVDEEARRSLSGTVSANINTPRDLTLALAHDEINIAKAVLENSPVLTPQDLAALARNQSKDHRLAISRRSDLDESVTDVLIEHGELEVLRSVSGNKNARISDWGFGTMAQYASDDAILQDNLSVRKDMSLKAAKNVLPFLPPEARSKLVSLMQDENGELTEFIGKVANDTSKEKIEITKTRLGAKKLICDIKAGMQTINKAVEILAQENQPMDCALLLAEFSGIPEEQAANALLKVNGEMISFLCKSIGIDSHHFHAIAVMRCERLHLPLSQAEHLTRQYETLDADTAKRTLRFVKVRNTLASQSTAA